MKRITVSTGKEYDILIGDGLLDEAGKHIRRALPGTEQLAIVTDSVVKELYANRLIGALNRAELRSSLHVIPAGEAHKTLETISDLYEQLSNDGITRTDAIIALGGGVVGDMAGFAAATWLRGIRVVQIPTTLLAQVDSSIGGKTGFNLKSGKNLVGAFHQPSLVLIDPTTLSTLSSGLFSEGMAEVIKYGCILDDNLFCRLERENAHDFMDELLMSCLECKRKIVERDEYEHGERILLNFGHTLGHALEKLHGYSDISHGEAVGIGMVLVSKAGERKGLTLSGTSERIACLLKKYGLPTEDIYSATELAAAAYTDKKHSGDTLRLVLLKKIGQAMIHTIHTNELEDFLSGDGSDD